MDLNSFELWRGSSALTDEPVVVIGSGFAVPSLNPKTGDAVQVYFLRADMPPADAVHADATRAICGECIHAPHRDATCYVNTAFAIQHVWRAWERGNCPPLHRDFWPSALRERFLRIGAYGDPAAAPDELTLTLASLASGHASYTHAWRDRPGLREACMASVGCDEERVEAEMLGWRAYQVVAMTRSTMRYLEPVGDGVVICGASAERGRLTTCSACRACGGASSKARSSIAVGAHGRNAPRIARLRRARSAPDARLDGQARLAAFIPKRGPPG